MSETSSASPAPAANPYREAVLASLAQYVNPVTGYAWPAQMTIARTAGVSLPTARKYLAEAAQDNVIRRRIVRLDELVELVGDVPAKVRQRWQRHYLYEFLSRPPVDYDPLRI